MWRQKHPSSKIYTWSNKDGSRQSRLDYWLVSKSLNKDEIVVNILPTPLTDHKATTIHLSFLSSVHDSKHCHYWKMNSSLLRYDNFKQEISRLISAYWQKAIKEDNFRRNWELFKFEADLRNNLSI